MYFEVLVVDFETPRVVDSSVGDEVFSGAQVVWDKLPRAEITWMMGKLLAAAQTWTGHPARPHTMDLRGTWDGTACAYALILDEQPACPWAELDSRAQTQVAALLDEVLLTINGLLEIV